MEKRTPNDADDAGPLGQHHQHHWGPVSSCQASRLSVSTGPASSASLGLRFTNLEVSDCSHVVLCVL